MEKIGKQKITQEVFDQLLYTAALKTSPYRKISWLDQLILIKECHTNQVNDPVQYYLCLNTFLSESRGCKACRLLYSDIPKRKDEE